MEYYQHLKLSLDYIKDATNNFYVGNFIGEGGFGKVYRGEMGETVGAVKRMHRSLEGANVSFCNEIMLLSSYRHENIISLIGFCDEKEEMIIVYEYASNNSLDHHLKNNDLMWIQRLKICLGAARGLEYLHNPKGTQQRVLHRDIKSANILLDENWNAKIADFGLSKYGPANQDHTFLFTNVAGTSGYCDPEYLYTAVLTKESDVYSFGVVLFEVLCSRLCVDDKFHDIRRNLPNLAKHCFEKKILHMIINVNLWQQMERISFNTFISLAYQCLERDPKRRPSMDLVVGKLQTALKYQEVFEANGNPLLEFEEMCPPGGGNLVILYTTSVEGIRKPFRDCSSVRFLLKHFKVLYQERDISIHSDFKFEVLKLLGRSVILPRLFIRGRYIGGAEDVFQLHEQGKFRPLLDRILLQMSEVPCKCCGGVRSVVCPNCDGRTTVNSDGHGLQTKCLKCNQNGLIKCPVCF